MSYYILQKHDNYTELQFLEDITLDVSLVIKEELKEYIADENIMRLAVNLDKVAFMDSSGLGLMISLFKEMNEKKGYIVFYGLGDYLKKLVQLVKLDSIFVIVDNAQDAQSYLASHA